MDMGTPKMERIDPIDRVPARSIHGCSVGQPKRRPGAVAENVLVIADIGVLVVGVIEARFIVQRTEILLTGHDGV